MTKERGEWRDIPGYTGYQASDTGGIRSRWFRGGRTSKLGDEWRELAQRANQSGYFRVSVQGGRASIASLVAAAFIGPRPSGMEINHIDGNKSNNSVANLEYTTRIGNMRHAATRGLIGWRRGPSHANAKLTIELADDIRKLFAEGKKVCELTEQFTVGEKLIWRVLHDKACIGSRSVAHIHLGIGERHCRAKLSADAVRQLRREYAAGGVTLAQLGNKYGVNGRTIGHAVSRHTFRDVE